MHRLAAEFGTSTNSLQLGFPGTDRGRFRIGGRTHRSRKTGTISKDSLDLTKESKEQDHVKVEATDQSPETSRGGRPKGGRELYPLVETSNASVGDESFPTSCSRQALFKDDPVAGSKLPNIPHSQEFNSIIKKEIPESSTEDSQQKGEENTPGTASPGNGIEPKDENKGLFPPTKIKLAGVKPLGEETRAYNPPASNNQGAGALPDEGVVVHAHNAPRPIDPRISQPRMFRDNSRIRALQRAIQYLSSVSPSFAFPKLIEIFR